MHKRLYELGNKAGKLLAWLDKQDQGNRWVPGLMGLDSAKIILWLVSQNTIASYVRV